MSSMMGKMGPGKLAYDLARRAREKKMARGGVVSTPKVEEEPMEHLWASGEEEEDLIHSPEVESGEVEEASGESSEDEDRKRFLYHFMMKKRLG